MTLGVPNYSPFPFARLRRWRRREVAIQNALVAWFGALDPKLPQLAALVGGPLHARLVGVRGTASQDSATAMTLVDPHAALAELRMAGTSCFVIGASRAVRQLAQHVLGGPSELAAPRVLTEVERAIWVLAVATAVTDLGLAAEVWPALAAPAHALVIELVVDSALGTQTVLVLAPPDWQVQPAPPRALRDHAIEAHVVLGRCLIQRADLRALRVRDVVTVERALELAIADGAIGLAAAPGAMEARVATGYVPRPMTLIDDAHQELSVTLGAVRLTLRQLAELGPGAIVGLGRPLAGPYEVRAGGRLVGHGELVDIEGEVGVRIVSLVES